jgi:hypothetical protein
MDLLSPLLLLKKDLYVGLIHILVMKGIELPINILVIVAIAVIVLLGLVALYLVGTTPFSSSMSSTSLKNSGCGNFTLSYNCGRTAGSTITKPSQICLPPNTIMPATATCPGGTLLNLCTSKLGIDAASATAEAQCAATCGC